MAIRTAPILSEQIYLGELSPEVKDIEGECDPKDRAWVKVRQATEQDAMQIAKLTQSPFLYTDDGVEQKATATSRDIRAMEMYFTLVDAGNFEDANGKELFQFINGESYQKVAGGLQEFIGRYGQLPEQVTAALSRAVYSVNPMWDWMAERRHRCPVCDNEFIPTDKTRVGEAERVK